MKTLLLLLIVAGAALALVYLRERRLLARDFKREAEQACREPVTLAVHGVGIGRLDSALREAAARAFPSVARPQLTLLVRRALRITCEACGVLSEKTINELIVTEASFGAGGQDMLGKDADTANRAGGACPGCGRTTFQATFDPAPLIASAKPA